MIRLHDHELSGSCHKVRLLLGFLGLPYDKVPVDFVNKQHKSADYLALNPFGELPVLEDGDLRLRDAQAILVYLASRYDPQRVWYPQDAPSQGRIQQWLATGGGEIMNASAARLVKALDYPIDLDRLHAGAHRAFAIVDAHLARRDFLECGRPTIADIACFPYAVLAWEGGIDVSGYTNMLAWVARMKQLPGFTPMPGL